MCNVLGAHFDYLKIDRDECSFIYVFKKPKRRDEACIELSVMEAALYAVVEIKGTKISEEGKFLF